MSEEEINYWLEEFEDNRRMYMSKDHKILSFYETFKDMKKLKQENTKLKNKLNNIKKTINGHIDGFITINNYGSCDDILEVLFDLKEVSEGDSNE